jgi:hypothetical protein
MAIVANESTGIYKVVYQGESTGKVKMTILNNRQTGSIHRSYHTGIRIYPSVQL